MDRHDGVFRGDSDLFPLLVQLLQLQAHSEARMPIDLQDHPWSIDRQHKRVLLAIPHGAIFLLEQYQQPKEQDRGH